jgi:hypothetical protein
MLVVWIVLGVVLLGGFGALYAWTRRSERDVDFGEMRDESTQTDEQRRANQLGIGLTSGSSITGHPK